jgi:archaellum biogenesis ATPase FlaH
MTIRVYLYTKNIDYSGYDALPTTIEIKDKCLKLHCCEKFGDDLIKFLNIHRINGVKDRVGIWHLYAKK